ncbi:hypothetical protein B0T16DRAFT_199907 [Cercophora newfieldiana]|uniref:Uncharacterized protein n=1 Tax=Cercophora newfieldiana TaxID=92897 RepID=A0AA39Y2S9_9PEZI|nr:hypothetical protein B0T16DRAFT_199907 [Cercophora newfieldiana]
MATRRRTSSCSSAISKLNPGGAEERPTQQGKLQISSRAFRYLMFTSNVPVAFIAALSRPYLVCGTGLRMQSSIEWDFWCLIPIRAAVPCHFARSSDHRKSTAGSNQMDPFHYIHLSGDQTQEDNSSPAAARLQSHDIRSSHIGLFVKHSANTGRISVVVVNLLDARQQHLINEPLLKARKAIKQRSGSDAPMSPRFIYLIYLSSTLRWWNNALLCFNQHLVKHEKDLQEEIASETSAFSNRSKDINSSLHLMAAHLHRYKSELQRIDLILTELLSPKFDPSFLVEEGVHPKGLFVAQHSDRLKVENLISQLKAICSFADEIERKIKDILTLLFHQIQATNDKTLQAILMATQADTKLSQKISLQSHQLTVSMKSDSIAMKTIAIMTMIFLPATSFAAIFAMPFFTESEYMQALPHIWIWVALTVTFTALAFGVFFYVIHRQKGVDIEDEQDESGVSGEKKNM